MKQNSNTYLLECSDDLQNTNHLSFLGKYKDHGSQITKVQPTGKDYTGSPKGPNQKDIIISNTNFISDQLMAQQLNKGVDKNQNEEEKQIQIFNQKIQSQQLTTKQLQISRISEEKSNIASTINAMQDASLKTLIDKKNQRQRKMSLLPHADWLANHSMDSGSGGSQSGSRNKDQNKKPSSRNNSVTSQTQESQQESEFDYENSSNLQEEAEITQKELYFNHIMNKLDQYSLQILLVKDYFKFGTENITFKDTRAHIEVDVETLKACQIKVQELWFLQERQYKQQIECLRDKHHKYAIKILKGQEINEKIKQLEQELNTRREGYQKLDIWFVKAIAQNIGKFDFHGKVSVYDQNSLHLFSYENGFRRKIVSITEQTYFDRFIICVILLGTICQAMYDYTDINDEGMYNQRISKILTVTSIIFICEATMKIIAQGLINHKNSYLRNGWNVMDFLVVLTSIIELILTQFAGNNIPSIKGLRALRVFRPLRSVQRVPSIRRFVRIMLRSLPELANTMVFMLFFFIVFGIMGIQTFHGAIYQRCRLEDEGTIMEDGKIYYQIDPRQSQQICSISNTTGYQCTEGTFCASPIDWELDPLLDDPWKDELINYNTNNFNNLITAIISIFEALTLEGWSGQMYKLMETGNVTLALIFYLLSVTIGSYFILNLILAVIMGSFTKFENQEIEEKIKQAEQAQQSEMKDGSKYNHRESVDDRVFTGKISIEGIDSFKADSSFMSGASPYNIKSAKSESRLSELAHPRLLNVDHSRKISNTQYTTLTKEPQTNQQTIQDNQQQNSLPFEGGYRIKKKLSKKAANRKIGNKLQQFLLVTSHKYADTKIFEFFNGIIKSDIFTSIVFLCIFVNTVTLSLDRYPIQIQEYESLEKINNTLTWIFLGELVIKVFGLGFRSYVMDSMNQFDAAVVIISIVEMIITDEESETTDLQQEDMSFTIFRGFRLLRVFRLARRWKSFHRMMVKIGETLNDIMYFFILLLIIVLVLAMLGVELYSNNVKFDKFGEIADESDIDSTSPQLNFDSFLEGVVVVFVGFIGEDWQISMHNQMRASENISPCLYFISLIILGNFFFMNLFLAILLKNFEENVQIDGVSQLNKEKEAQEKQAISKLKRSITNLRIGFKRVILRKETDKQKEIKTSEMTHIQDLNVLKKIQLGALDNQITKPQGNQNQSSQSSIDLIEKIQKEKQQQAISKILKVVSQRNTKTNIMRETFQVHKSMQSSQKILQPHKTIVLQGKSLHIFSKENNLRRMLSKVVVHEAFDFFIFLIVLVTLLLLVIEDPLQDPENPHTYQFVPEINEVVTIIFFLEFVIKLVVYGLIFNGDQSYLRSGWNIIDFIVVLSSSVSLAQGYLYPDDVSTSFLEYLKLLRLARSLRIITRNEDLKLSVLSLIYSLPGIMNVTVVSFLFILLFAIFFLNMLKGKLYYCKQNQDIIDYYYDSIFIVNKQDCVNYGGDWANNQFNFDNVANSMTALFTISTTEGWVDFMLNSVNAVGINLEPRVGSNPSYQLIFIIYMLFGSLFITNLFIQVVINTFEKQKELIDRNYMLTEFQKEWIQLQLKCYNHTPKIKLISENLIRQKCIMITELQWFDSFIMGIIILNTIALTMVWVGIDPNFLKIIEEIQNFFNIIFLIECIIKLIAYEQFYFQNGWNNFDFIIVAGGVLGAFFESSFTQHLSVIRILRVGRVLRLLKKAKSLYAIFNSFVHTIPAFVNVGSLIMVLIYIFASVGNRLLPTVKIHGSLDQHVNFQSFGTSFLSLIMVMTGEGWYQVMADLAQKRDVDFDCIESPTYQDYVDNGYETIGCGSEMSYTFFILYVFCVSQILVNLFIAVTLQGFEQVQIVDSCRITDLQIEIFISQWANIDPDGTGYIHISDIRNFFMSLIHNQSELFPPKTKELVYDADLLPELIQHLQLKLYKRYQYYNFHDILIALSQMYLSYLASREEEQAEILEEYEKIHGGDPKDIDVVINKINEMYAQNNVNMCKKLNKALIKFKNNIHTKIDKFDGNVFTSQMIPIVLRIQRRFRQKYRLKVNMGELSQSMSSKLDISNIQFNNQVLGVGFGSGVKNWTSKAGGSEVSGLKDIPYRTQSSQLPSNSQFQQGHNFLHVIDTEQSNSSDDTPSLDSQGLKDQWEQDLGKKSKSQKQKKKNPQKKALHIQLIKLESHRYLNQQDIKEAVKYITSRKQYNNISQKKKESGQKLQQINLDTNILQFTLNTEKQVVSKKEINVSGMKQPTRQIGDSVDLIEELSEIFKSKETEEEEKKSEGNNQNVLDTITKIQKELINVISSDGHISPILSSIDDKRGSYQICKKVVTNDGHCNINLLLTGNKDQEISIIAASEPHRNEQVGQDNQTIAPKVIRRNIQRGRKGQPIQNSQNMRNSQNMLTEPLAQTNHEIRRNPGLIPNQYQNLQQACDSDMNMLPYRASHNLIDDSSIYSSAKGGSHLPNRNLNRSPQLQKNQDNSYQPINTKQDSKLRKQSSRQANIRKGKSQDMLKNDISSAEKIQQFLNNERVKNQSKQINSGQITILDKLKKFNQQSKISLALTSMGHIKSLQQNNNDYNSTNFMPGPKQLPNLKRVQVQNLTKDQQHKSIVFKKAQQILFHSSTGMAKNNGEVCAQISDSDHLQQIYLPRRPKKVKIHCSKTNNVKPKQNKKH